MGLILLCDLFECERGPCAVKLAKRGGKGRCFPAAVVRGVRESEALFASAFPYPVFVSIFHPDEVGSAAQEVRGVWGSSGLTSVQQEPLSEQKIFL